MKNALLSTLILLVMAAGCGSDKSTVFPPRDAIDYFNFDSSLDNAAAFGPGSPTLEISTDSPYRGNGCLLFTYNEIENDCHYITIMPDVENATSSVAIEFRMKVTHPGRYILLINEDSQYDYLASVHATSTDWEKYSIPSIRFYQDADNAALDPNRVLDGDKITMILLADMAGVFNFQNSGEKKIFLDDFLIIPHHGGPMKITDKTGFKKLSTGRIGFCRNPYYDDMIPNNQLVSMKDYVEAGCQFHAVNGKWAELETAPGAYDFTGIVRMNEYYDRNIPEFRERTTFSYEVLIINMDARSPLPADLDGAAFDNALLISRYTAFVKAFLNASEVETGQSFWFFVANETDTYLEAHESEIPAFKSFYSQVKTALKAEYPNMRIGVITKYHGTRHDINASINESSDVVAYTYYGFGGNFSFADPDDLDNVFSGMVASAGLRPVVITEIGFATSALLDSDVYGQADYVGEFFETFPQYKDSIVAVSWFLQTDLGDDLLDEIMKLFPGFEDNEEFKAYLQYLGLFYNDGTPKPAVSKWVGGMKSFYRNY